MEVKTIVQEIQRLPITKRFWVIEQTLKSIKKEELSHQVQIDAEGGVDLSFLANVVSEKSLAKDWLSIEDSRWDKILKSMYKQGDIVVVKFPFTDGSQFKKRPALVISNDIVNKTGDYLNLETNIEGFATLKQN